MRITASKMTNHKTGTREEWLAARRELLEAEKELTRRSDELARRHGIRRLEAFGGTSPNTRLKGLAQQ
jgi:predicted dithiol-disulfide oxidoreductase (DUF899 family)